jgi:hypothetical protein
MPSTESLLSSFVMADPWQLGYHVALWPSVSGGSSMNLQARLDALKERHAALETRILDEDQRPRPDSETLTRLKIEKLRVKEEMERLRTQNG